MDSNLSLSKNSIKLNAKILEFKWLIYVMRWYKWSFLGKIDRYKIYLGMRWGVFTYFEKNQIIAYYMCVLISHSILDISIAKKFMRISVVCNTLHYIIHTLWWITYWILLYYNTTYYNTHAKFPGFILYL